MRTPCVCCVPCGSLPSWTSGWRRDGRRRASLRPPSWPASPRERVAEELKRLVCGPAAGRVLLDCPEVLTRQVLPELAPAVGFDQRNPHHSYDVYTHCVRALGGSRRSRGCGWRLCSTTWGSRGAVPWTGRGWATLRTRRRRGGAGGRLPAPPAAGQCPLRERVVTLIRRHDLQLEPEPRLVKRWLGRLGPELFFQWTALAKADAGGQISGPGSGGSPLGSRWRHWQDRSWPRGPASPCGTWRRTETTPWPGACGGPRWAGRWPPPAGRGDGGPSPPTTGPS